MRKMIESRHNADFKRLVGLAISAKDRRLFNQAWVEGDRLCHSFLAAANSPLPCLVTTPAHEARLTAEISQSIGDIFVLDEKLFQEISQVQAGPGWGLVVPIPRRSLQEAPAKDQQEPDIAILDAIADPGNAGTLLRSAAAAGVKVIWALSGSVDLWSPKVLRAAMGAHVALHLVEDLSWADCLQQIQKKSAHLFATALSNQAQSLFAPGLDLTKPCAWVFGQEAAGVRPEILKAAQQIMIPQQSGVESLNVAAAAAICLFEMRRQRISAQY
jgi:RNA methyltransferase, TrmH family